LRLLARAVSKAAERATLPRLTDEQSAQNSTVERFQQFRFAAQVPRLKREKSIPTLAQKAHKNRAPGYRLYLSTRRITDRSLLS